MAENDVQNNPHLGQKLRAARLRRQLSLRELAERAEISASMLSKIENGKANPSVRSLHSIAEALSLPVHYLFPQQDRDSEATTGSDDGLGPVIEPDPDRDEDAEAVGNLTASQLRAAQAAALIDDSALGFEAETPHIQGPMVPAEARQTIELLGGVTWTRLTPGPEEGIEFLEICYDVGARSGEQMSHHAGRELHYVLEGELLLELGFERYQLRPGDSIIFDSTTPHRLSNAGQVPMRAISVIFNKA